MKPIPNAAAALSLASLVCAAAASTVTLAYSGAFPDPPAAALNRALSEARGWSLVTICLALPWLAGSLIAGRRGSLRGRLAWLGTLTYLVYTYLEFAVSPPFTPLFLVYIGAFACAIPALLMGLSSIDLSALPEAFSDRVPRRSIATFALTSAVVLALAWLKGILARTVSGDFGWPQGVDAIGHVVHALDLGLQVPLGIATWALLMRRRPSGYVAAAVMLVNSICMGAALTAMVTWAAIDAGRSGVEGLPLAGVPLIAGILAALFFRALRGAKGDREGRRPRADSRPEPRPNLV